MSDTRRIARLFRPYRGRLAAVLALIAVSAGLGIVTPFLLRAVLDEAIPQRDTTLLALLVGGMVGIAIATGVPRFTCEPSTSSSASTTTPIDQEPIPRALRDQPRSWPHP